MRPSMFRDPILLLDVMDTLVYDPIFVDVPRALGMSLRELFERSDPNAWPAFERNEIDEGTYFQRFRCDGLGRPFDGKLLIRAMRAGYRWLDGIEPLLDELRAAGVPMHALSNYPSWYRFIEEKLAVSRYVEWSFVSCRTGVRKPEPEAYLGAARELGVSPSDCIFVDDREGNCDAARVVGMRALQFANADALRGDLTALGVLAR